MTEQTSHVHVIAAFSPTAFQFLCIALAIDTIDVSNEARRELLPNKSKVMLYLLFVTW